jgi:hypothetical protein
MKEALDALSADLLAAGISPRVAQAVRQSYARALERQDTLAWVGFYRAVFAALQHSDVAPFPESKARRAARASLQLLLNDDLGSALFSDTSHSAFRLRSLRELRST